MKVFSALLPLRFTQRSFFTHPDSLFHSLLLEFIILTRQLYAPVKMPVYIQSWSFWHIRGLIYLRDASIYHPSTPAWTSSGRQLLEIPRLTLVIAVNAVQFWTTCRFIILNAINANAIFTFVLLMSYSFASERICNSVPVELHQSGGLCRRLLQWDETKTWSNL